MTNPTKPSESRTAEMIDSYVYVDKYGELYTSTIVPTFLGWAVAVNWYVGQPTFLKDNEFERLVDEAGLIYLGVL